MSEHDVSSTAQLLHVRQGANNYEWHIYYGDSKVATRPTQKEAAAFMDGYEIGLRHGRWAR